MTVILENTTPDGKALKAKLLPELGMNLCSYQKDGLEVIDQSTKQEFEFRFSGLGPLIGPHFHHQKKEWIQSGYDESLFPHIARIRERKIADPFSHGIARYVPWKYVASKNKIQARLSSEDTYRGVKLLTFEGVDFEMQLNAELLPSGLEIELSVESSRECLCGLHYYYAINNHEGTVRSVVQDVYSDNGIFKPIPKEWLNKEGWLEFDLKNAADFGFLPSKDYGGEVFLNTKSHNLKVSYEGKDDEISWQLFSPKNSSFACIEPLSTKNPRKLEAKSSGFIAKIEIL